MARGLDRAQEAERSLRQALKIRPETVNILVALGQSLLTQGRVEEALHELDSALSLRPSSTEAMLIKSRALVNRGLIGEAIQTLEQAAQLAPQDATINEELKSIRNR